MVVGDGRRRDLLPAAHLRQRTGPFGAIIAWVIAGGGMYMLARVFQSLAERKPDLDAGVYAYAKAGFGDYPGFLSAFGYWIGSCIGNVSYWVLIKSTLGAFFPVFGDGNTVAAIVVASVGIWLFHFMILRGVQQAAFINTIVTIAKIVPILVFILILFVAFKADLFRANFWGGEGMPETSLFEQVRATMLVTVFVFLGIEGASVYSRFAKKRSDVGTATIMGFVGVTTLMVLVTDAAVCRAAARRDRRHAPAVDGDGAGGRGRAVGRGVHQRRAARLGARRLSGLVADLRRGAVRRRQDQGHAEGVRDGEREQGAGRGAVADQHRRPAVRHQHLLVQRRVLADAQPHQRYGADPVPAGGGIRPAARQARRDLRDRGRSERRRDMIFAGIAVIYTLFLIYAGGMKFMVLSAILYAPGNACSISGRDANRASTAFTPVEWVIFGRRRWSAASIGIYGLATGCITI